MRAVSEADQKKVCELLAHITDIDIEMEKLRCEKEQVENEILSIKLAPFKIGDEVIAPIPSGRSTKDQKCVIECERGICYLRPYKKDGTLSDRHFSCTPVGKSYAELFKEVV